MEELKYELGLKFLTKEDQYTRDGFVPSGTTAHIDEIDETEHDGDGTLTPYKVFFEVCLTDEGEPLTDNEGTTIGGSDWFSELELEKLI